MTVVGVVLAVVLLAGLLVAPKNYLGIVIFTIPFHDNALFASGRVTISPYFAAVSILALVQSYYWLSSRRTSSLGTHRVDVVEFLLASLIVYSIVTTLLGPAVFAGTPVAVAGAGLDEQVGRLSSLEYSISNLAQALYLALNVFLVLHVARSRSDWKRPLKIALISGVAIAATDVGAIITGVDWPHLLFDSDTRISENLAKVATRARGQFSEPSHLAAFSLAASVYLLNDSWHSESGGGRLSSLLGAVLALLCLFYSASGAALIGAIVAGSAMLVIILFRVLAVGRVNAAFVAAVSLLVISAPLLALYLAQVLRDMVAKKSATGSYRNRGYADANSIEVFYRTYGFGSGLGSNRGSSLLLMLLATVGAVGSLVFLAILCRLTVRLIKPHAGIIHTPASWALLAYSVTLLIAYADFVSAVLWVLIACCYSDYRASYNSSLASGGPRSLWTAGESYAHLKPRVKSDQRSFLST